MEGLAGGVKRAREHGRQAAEPVADDVHAGRVERRQNVGQDQRPQHFQGGPDPFAVLVLEEMPRDDAPVQLERFGQGPARKPIKDRRW